MHLSSNNSQIGMATLMHNANNNNNNNNNTSNNKAYVKVITNGGGSVDGGGGNIVSADNLIVSSIPANINTNIDSHIVLSENNNHNTANGGNNINTNIGNVIVPNHQPAHSLLITNNGSANANGLVSIQQYQQQQQQQRIIMSQDMMSLPFGSLVTTSSGGLAVITSNSGNGNITTTPIAVSSSNSSLLSNHPITTSEGTFYIKASTTSTSNINGFQQQFQQQISSSGITANNGSNTTNAINNTNNNTNISNNNNVATTTRYFAQFSQQQQQPQHQQPLQQSQQQQSIINYTNNNSNINIHANKIVTTNRNFCINRNTSSNIIIGSTANQNMQNATRLQQATIVNKIIATKSSNIATGTAANAALAAGRTTKNSTLTTTTATLMMPTGMISGSGQNKIALKNCIMTNKAAVPALIKTQNKQQTQQLLILPKSQIQQFQLQQQQQQQNLQNQLFSKQQHKTEFKSSVESTINKTSTPTAAATGTVMNGNTLMDKENLTKIPQNEKLIKSEPEPEPEIDIVISNVVCSFSVRCHLNLREIALSGINVEYRRENGMVTMKLRRPYTTASIWSSGRITCTGSTSEDQAKIAARRYSRLLQKLGFPVKFSNFHVVNVLGTCSMPWAIKIVNFSEKYKANASYEPELHPGVTYKLTYPKATLKIFSTGSITVTAVSVANVQAAIEHIFPLVYEFRKPRSPEELEQLRLKIIQNARASVIEMKPTTADPNVLDKKDIDNNKRKITSDINMMKNACNKKKKIYLASDQCAGAEEDEDEEEQKEIFKTNSPDGLIVENLIEENSIDKDDNIEIYANFDDPNDLIEGPED